MTIRQRAAGLAVALVAAALAFFGASTAGAAIEVHKVAGKSGVVAWLVEDRSNPIVSVSFGFRAGGSLDPDGKEGLAELTSVLLDEGAGGMNALAFQKKLENLSISLEFEVGRDQFRGTLRTLSRHRAAAFRMIGLALTEPRFDADAVERMRGNLLASYRRNTQRPNYLARRAFWSSAYPDHPYGRPVSGTEKSLGTIGRADLKRFVADNFTRDNLFIGVVGDVTPAQLAVLLDTAFGGLPAQQKRRPVPAVAPNLPGGIVVKKFDTPQSVAVFGQPGLPRRHPDYYAAYILNHIIGGGGFTSRLYPRNPGEARSGLFCLFLSVADAALGSFPGRCGDPECKGCRIGPDRQGGMGPDGRTGAERRRTGRGQEIPYRQLSAALLQFLADCRHAGRTTVRKPGTRLFRQTERLYRKSFPGGCPAGCKGTAETGAAHLRRCRQAGRPVSTDGITLAGLWPAEHSAGRSA